MTKDWWTHHFAAHGPWVTRFRIADQDYGGEYDARGDGRIDLFCKLCPAPTRILELGSLEGGHTLALAGLGYTVLALEGRAANVRRAEFVCQGLCVAGIEFRQVDLETCSLDGLGRFDCCFCVGLLYHLERPWELLARIAAVSRQLYLWTHYARDDETTLDGPGGIRGKRYVEHGLDDPLSGLGEWSFWPDRSGLLAMVRTAGFSSVEIIQEQECQGGPAMSLWATA